MPHDELTADRPDLGVDPTADRWFHDRHGRLVIWQRPNLPLILWGVGRLLSLVVRSGWSGRAVDALAFGSLFAWAWLELTDGSAHVRRLLGLVVLVGLIATRAVR